MFKYILLLYFASAISAQDCFVSTNVTSGTELLLSFVIHRHGDRTPVETSINLVNVPKDEIEKKIYPNSYGALTNKGKWRGYCIGEILRQRYDVLLSNIYFENEISVITTNITRTKMTALTAMAALYPPTLIQRWNDKLNWQPVPYSTLPPATSFLSFFYNCPYYVNKSLFNVTLSEDELEPYSDLLNYLGKKTGLDLFRTPMNIYNLNDIYDSFVASSIELPSWVPPIRAKLTDAASLTLHAMFKTDKVKRLSGGVFYHKFLKTAASVIAGEDVKQRVRIFSTHDINVAAELATAGLPYHLVKFGGLLAIELHRVSETGQYVVIPVYVPSPGESGAEVLPIPDCDADENSYCDFDTFKLLMTPFAITEEQQRVECQE